MVEKLAIIGDVHGCRKTLMALLDRLPPRDAVYCVGDLIDRGPDSRGTVALVKERGIQCVLGNHEWLLLTGWHASMPNHESWLLNGGGDTLRNYNNQTEVQELAETLRTFPLFIDIDMTEGPNLLICHAGVRKGMSLKDSIDALHDREVSKIMSSVLWNRGKVSLKDHFVIHGHSPVEEPHLTADSMNIDTGCVYRNRLTAVLWPERTFIQVPYQED